MGYSPWDHKELDTTEQLTLNHLGGQPCQLLNVFPLIWTEGKDIYSHHFNSTLYLEVLVQAISKINASGLESKK